MMHGDLRGFYGAPVTYAITMAVGAASSASLLMGYSHLFVLRVGRDMLLRKGLYWRVFANQLAFQNGLAASLGLYILFQYRMIERHMGSRQFGSLVFFIWAITAAVQLSTLQSFPMWKNRLSSGPYALIGALTIYFMKFIPRLQPKAYNIAGIHFSDKSLTYGLCLVMLATNPRSVFAFFPGAALGVLFSSTPLFRLQLPSFICGILSIFHPFFEVTPASVTAQQRQQRILEAQRRLGVRQAAANAPAGHGFRDQLIPGAMGGPMRGGFPAGGDGGMLPPQMAATPPPEAAIEQLLALGFDRERVIVALQATDNNVEAAANRLLMGQ